MSLNAEEYFIYLQGMDEFEFTTILYTTILYIYYYLNSYLSTFNEEYSFIQHVQLLYDATITVLMMLDIILLRIILLLYNNI